MDADRERFRVQYCDTLFIGTWGHCVSYFWFLVLQDTSSTWAYYGRDRSKRKIIVRFNQFDVVSRIGCQSHVYLILLLYERSHIFFVYFACKSHSMNLPMQIPLCDSTYAACGLQSILDQAIERMGYHWFYGGWVLTTHVYQFSLTITLEPDLIVWK